jgi:hypothetical protein
VSRHPPGGVCCSRRSGHRPSPGTDPHDLWVAAPPPADTDSLGFGDLHVFPAYIKVGCAYRLYPTWPWRCRCQCSLPPQRAVWGCAARTAPARRREPESVSRPSAGRVAWRPVPGQVPGAAPLLIPHVAQHRADMRAGLRHDTVPLPERRTPTGPAPDGTARRSTQSPGFPRSAGEHAARSADAAAGSGSDHWTVTRRDHLQIRQQSLAEMALREGQVMTRRQSHWTDEAGFAQVTGWRTPVQRLETAVVPAPAGGICPIRTHIRRPTRPPLLYFPAVLAVRCVRISLLTCGAKRARTADLLHAIWRQHVHPRPSVQVTVLPRPRTSARVRVSCCTSVLYRCHPRQEHQSCLR